tara:strand:+ start:536 stop:1180 length:645 start_codon:yes stop_codon:yes gene_type:complete
MDEDISIINANTRNEKIKYFFTNNKKKIISAIIFLLIILVSSYSYDKYTTNKKIGISEKYNSIIIDYSGDEKIDTLKNLIEIIKIKDPTYSPLSLYFIIDNNLLDNEEQINAFFDILIEETSLDEEIKNLTLYKKALFNADNILEGDLLKMLNPLINSESVWNSHALYLIAEYFYSNEQKEKSKEFFNKIISLENSNTQIRQSAKKRLNRDLSD